MLPGRIDSCETAFASASDLRVVLPARSKQAIVLSSLDGLAGISGTRGLIVFSAPNGAVAVLGLRFGPEAFTSIPVQ